MCRDGEGEADVHAGAVPLDRRVEELLDLGKINDFIEFAVDFRLLHPQDAAVQINVLAARQLRVKTSPYFEEAAHAAAQFDAAGRWLRDPAENFQERAFPRAIAPDDADHF